MSYELVGGGGMRGLGALGASGSECGQTRSRDLPPNLSSVQMQIFNSGPQNLICDPRLDAATAELCNKSGMPLYCYNAKFHGANLLGRGSAADVAAWVSWTPTGQDLVPPGSTVFGQPVPPTPGLPPAYNPPGMAPDGGIPDWAVGLGIVGALAVVAGVVWKVTH